MTDQATLKETATRFLAAKDRADRLKAIYEEARLEHQTAEGERREAERALMAVAGPTNGRNLAIVTPDGRVVCPAYSYSENRYFFQVMPAMAIGPDAGEGRDA